MLEKGDGMMEFLSKHRELVQCELNVQSLDDKTLARTFLKLHEELIDHAKKLGPKEKDEEFLGAIYVYYDVNLHKAERILGEKD